MPTTINKQRILSQLLNGSKSKAPTATAANSILSHFAYAICREGALPENADQAYQRLVDRFFDWNEIRVSSPREIQETFEGLPHAEERAIRLIRMLQEVFETTFSFDLEPLIKKGAKPAAKHLSRYEAASDFAISWILLKSFDAHSLPLDEHCTRVLHRLGLIDEASSEPAAAREGLEALVPKSRGHHMADSLSLIANEYCTEREPACGRCPLHLDCMTGQQHARLARSASSRGHRPKPR
jgi:endonuclease III